MLALSKFAPTKIVQQFAVIANLLNSQAGTTQSTKADNQFWNVTRQVAMGVRWPCSFLEPSLRYRIVPATATLFVGIQRFKEWIYSPTAARPILYPRQ